LPAKDINAEAVIQSQKAVVPAVQDQISLPQPAASLNGLSFKEMSVIANRPPGLDRGTRGGT
jgi:hypothetical protein